MRLESEDVEGEDGFFRLKPGRPDPYSFVRTDGHEWAYRSHGWGIVEVRCSCGWGSGAPSDTGVRITVGQAY